MAFGQGEKHLTYVSTKDDLVSGFIHDQHDHDGVSPRMTEVMQSAPSQLSQNLFL